MQHVLPNPQVQRLTALTAALVIGGLGGAGIAVIANEDGAIQANSPSVSAPAQVSVFPESATASQASQRSVPSQVSTFPEAATGSQASQPAHGRQFGGRLP